MLSTPRWQLRSWFDLKCFMSSFASRLSLVLLTGLWHLTSNCQSTPGLHFFTCLSRCWSSSVLLKQLLTKWLRFVTCRTGRLNTETPETGLRTAYSAQWASHAFTHTPARSKAQPTSRQNPPTSLWPWTGTTISKKGANTETNVRQSVSLLGLKVYRTSSGTDPWINVKLVKHALCLHL